MAKTKIPGHGSKLVETSKMDKIADKKAGAKEGSAKDKKIDKQIGAKLFKEKGKKGK